MRWSTPHAVSAPPVTLFHGPTPSLVRQLGEWCSRVSLMLREAQTQTFADAFLVAAVCFAVATMMVPPMRKVAPQAAPV
jgi:hypothetical protein